MGSSSSKPMPVFGGRIGDHLDEDGVNRIVKWLLEAIERTGQGVRTLGLYRVCGGHAGVQRTSKQTETELKILVDKEKDVHVLTGSLKLYLRSLKEPILRIEDFQDAIKGRRNGEDTSDKLCDVINSLPDHEKLTLAYLFQHLNRVMHETQNHMSLASLGVVFGPALMRASLPAPAAREDPAALEASLEELNLVVELLLQHYNKVFNDFTLVDKKESALGGSDTRPSRVAVDPSVKVATFVVDSSTDGIAIPRAKLVGSGTLTDTSAAKRLTVGSYPDNESRLSLTNPSLDPDSYRSKRTSLPCLGATRPNSEVSRTTAIMTPADESDIEDWLVHAAKALTPEAPPDITTTTKEDWLVHAAKALTPEAPPDITTTTKEDFSEFNKVKFSSTEASRSHTMEKKGEDFENLGQSIDSKTLENAEDLVSKIEACTCISGCNTDLNNCVIVASKVIGAEQSTSVATLDAQEQSGGSVVVSLAASVTSVTLQEQQQLADGHNETTNGNNANVLDTTVGNSELQQVYERVTHPIQYYNSQVNL